MFFSPCSNFFFIELEQSLDPNTNSAKSLSNVFSFHIYPSLLPCQTHRPCSAELPLPSLLRLSILFLSSFIFSSFSLAPSNGRTAQKSPWARQTLFQILPLLLRKRNTRLVVLFVRSAEQASLFVTRPQTSLQWSTGMLIVSLGILSFISSSWSSSLIPFIKAHHRLPLDPPLERPSFILPKVPQRLWHILLQNEGVLNAQKKSASTTSNQILMSQSLKPIAYFVPLATSGSVLGLIPLTAPYHGMLIVRAAWQRRCGLYTLSFVALFILFPIRNNKNVYALDERNTLFSKDSDVRKFDAERLLCNMCDKWMNVPPDDHLQAVQKWLQHRASCQLTS